MLTATDRTQHNPDNCDVEDGPVLTFPFGAPTRVAIRKPTASTELDSYARERTGGGNVSILGIWISNRAEICVALV